MFYNEFEIESAVRKHDANVRPNFAILANTVYTLMEWTNANSDGWAYWQKPQRAAAKATAYLEAFDNLTWREEPTDLPDADLKAALTPIKAFLTRQGVAHESIIARIVRA